MFDGAFFRFSVGFIAIIGASLCVLYFSGYFSPDPTAEVTASTR